MWGRRARNGTRGADVTARPFGDKAGRGPAVGGTRSGAYRRTRQKLLDLDRDLVAADDDGALGHRQVIGEDAHLVFLRGIELDDGSAAEAEHLVDRHGARPQDDRNVDRDVIECRHGSPPFWFCRRQSIMLTPLWLRGG